MIRQRNPLDPLDDVKRWWAELYLLERLGVFAAAAVILTLLSLWVFR